MKVTVLGCGASGGVPLTGGIWGDCDPGDPRNRRTRSSLLVEQGGTTVLVDTGPDMRQQLLAAGVTKLDAVLYTHAHADHLHGIDDLRALNVSMGRAIDAHGSAETLRQITRRFDYAFRPDPGPRPRLKPIPIDGPFQVGDIDVVPFDQDHHVCISTGFRFGPVGYSTDVVRLGEAAFTALAGIEVWIVGALQYAPHPIHAHVDLVLEWIARLKPRRAILTHMNHTLDFAPLAARLPAGVEPAVDGLVIEL